MAFQFVSMIVLEDQGLNGNEDLDEDRDEDRDEDHDEDHEEDHEEDRTVSPSPGTEGHPVDDKLWYYVGNCGIIRMVIVVVCCYVAEAK